MSRSYRYPMWVDSYGSRFKYLDKRFANKTVRQKNKRYTHNLSHYHQWGWDEDSKEDYHRVPDGMAYKKFSDPWDIVDSKHEYTLKGYWFISWYGNDMIWMEPDPKWKAIRK
ncbi:MAG: hypothetical protein ACTSW1_07565 [Candidatus Hodarchaeales archaeon]